MEQPRYTVVAPTTGGMVRIERIRARPRLQASYAALKGDFRPLALSADYHNFVSGPLSAHGLVEGAHELLISEDIDSGRSWEIPVLIAHLLEANARLDAPESDADTGAQPNVIWATGSVDPELHPQAADYAVARKCEIAAPLFAEWQDQNRTVHLVVPAGMPTADVEAVRQVADTHGFDLTIASSFETMAHAIGHAAAEAPLQSSSADIGPTTLPFWRKPGPIAASALGLVAAAALTLYALGSAPSTPTAGTTPPLVAGGTTKGKISPITLVRLGANDRSDCIDRIMLTQPMTRTTIPLTNGAYRIDTAEGLCGLRFINQSPNALTIRMTGDLLTAAIRGNDALFQGVSLPTSDATDLIFSQPTNGLTASLQLDDTTIPVVIAASKEATQ